ncbi:MAG TPA: peptidoglycan DD-metalloendopeptidase family protein [Puia sp.]|nr:peptidoglycan DD-metalloendopeptidase family protein [Puia sp.]
MKKLINITAGALLMAAVLSGLSVEAHGLLPDSADKPVTVLSEGRGKAAAKRTSARRRTYRSSSRRSSHASRLRSSSHVAKNAAHKVSKSYRPNPVFGEQKGNLPWPVDSRKISMHFGLQNYNVRGVMVQDSTRADDPDYVKIDNLGIVIDAGKGAIVKAVMDGVVDDVMDIGDGVAVLIKHGNYFFIYSDLSAVVVNKGQEVTTGTILGELGDEGQLDFRLYDASDVWLDPEKWLESPELKKR